MIDQNVLLVYSLTQFLVAENCECAVDHVMHEETAIVGDAKGSFLFRRRNQTQHYDMFFFDAAALVFARDQNKSDGTIFSFFLNTMF